MNSMDVSDLKELPVDDNRKRYFAYLVKLNELLDVGFRLSDLELHKLSAIMKRRVK